MRAEASQDFSVLFCIESGPRRGQKQRGVGIALESFRDEDALGLGRRADLQPAGNPSQLLSTSLAGFWDGFWSKYRAENQRDRSSGLSLAVATGRTAFAMKAERALAAGPLWLALRHH